MPTPYARVCGKGSLVAWADEEMKICAIILSCFYVAVSAHAATTVPAWQNVVESNATEAVVRDYVSNVIRVEWAGQDNVVSRLMPANLSCQFAVIGDAEVTNRVKAVLQNTIDALNPGLRSELEKYHLINPTLQWLARSIISFSQLRLGGFRSKEFVSPDEMILPSHSSGAPETTRRVEYFVSPERDKVA